MGRTPCPEYGETAVKTTEDSPRVWCSNCRYAFTTPATRPSKVALTPDAVVIAFLLYADTLLSISQIAQLFEAVYDTVHTTIREVEAAFERGFPLVWARIQDAIDGPTQFEETGQKCSGFKGQTPPLVGLSRRGSGDPGRTRWEGDPEIR